MTEKHLSLKRNILKDQNIDIEKRAIVIAFNEPRFKKSYSKQEIGDIDAKLNARFISYFLPAVELARMQKERPRFLIVSGLNMALKWNAQNEEQRKIMIANNALKMDFLKTFFEKFFTNEFSLIEYVIQQDSLKVSESKFLALWNLLEKKYKDELREIRFQLTKFIYPKQFNVSSYNDMNEAQRRKMKEVDISRALKYAINHLFVFVDANFEGNYVHNDAGYVSVGGSQEEYFNIVRDFAFEIVRDYGEFLFEREVICFENKSIILKNKYNTPPPYNGYYVGNNSKSKYNELLEVTYENERSLDYYDSIEKLRDQIDYVYENILSQEDYQKFWDNYRIRYFDLKERYREAYKIGPKW